MTLPPTPALRTVTPSHCPSLISLLLGGASSSDSTPAGREQHARVIDMRVAMQCCTSRSLATKLFIKSLHDVHIKCALERGKEVIYNKRMVRMCVLHKYI